MSLDSFQSLVVLHFMPPRRACSTIFATNSYLKHSTNIKLHWGASHDEVCGLVDVTNGPHDHHQEAHAVR